MPGDNTSLDNGHGMLGKREANFTRLLPKKIAAYEPSSLSELASLMNSEDEFHDGPDGEENLFVPAGYTYFGQFVDHDLTFDTTSSLKPLTEDPDQKDATNLRTPRFDLDCLYGAGPGDQPYMYDGAKLLFGTTLDGGGKDDLIRIGVKGKERAVVGDKRNDENSIICQIQLAFIKFHNKVVDKLVEKKFAGNLFERARDEVRWTYQKILIEDYLRRITDAVTYDFFEQKWRASGEAAYLLYTADKRGNIPIEFAGAAYRFGHSMIRQGYRLSPKAGKDIFKPEEKDQADSFIGFGPLSSDHVIDDWRRFFADNTLLPGQRELSNIAVPGAKDTDVRLQWAYKIDPSLANPLASLPLAIASRADFPLSFRDELPSLSRFNLFRGNKFGLESGQVFAQKIGAIKLEEKYLQVRTKTADGGFTFTSIETVDPAFLKDTPLWFYVLAEAQKPIIDMWIDKGRRNLTDDDFMTGPGAVSQLGAVGGTILLEVFFGLMDADPESFRAAERNGWSPMISNSHKNPSPCTMWTLLEFTGLV